MKIAVVGGTGTLGSAVVAALTGPDVVALGRSTSPSIDLRDGTGFDEALQGVDVVIDASNAPAGAKAAAVFVAGTRRLLDAEARAGVSHHVGVSIVGCEHIDAAYYRAKREQERIVETGPVPWSIVRATQFHDFLAALFTASARYGAVPAPRGVLQPVDVEVVARLIADVALGPPRHDRAEITGPRVEPIPTLAQAWKTARRSRAVVVPVPLPRAIGHRIRAGALTNPGAPHRGQVTFEAWL